CYDISDEYYGLCDSNVENFSSSNFRIYLPVIAVPLIYTAILIAASVYKECFGNGLDIQEKISLFIHSVAAFSGLLLMGGIVSAASSEDSFACSTHGVDGKLWIAGWFFFGLAYIANLVWMVMSTGWGESGRVWVVFANLLMLGFFYVLIRDADWEFRVPKRKSNTNTSAPLPNSQQNTSVLNSIPLSSKPLPTNPPPANVPPPVVPTWTPPQPAKATPKTVSKPPSSGNKLTNLSVAKVYDWASENCSDEIADGLKANNVNGAKLVKLTFHDVKTMMPDIPRGEIHGLINAIANEKE
ncbi:hypothetical protein HDU83_007028, partial [Entophlyctis luteolus]